MKNIYRLFTAALVLLGAAACNPSEINNPDNPDTPQGPDTPQDSEFSITANIVKTRVSYYDIGADLDQKWESGDVLFGYYGESADNKVILYVSGFDGAGNAILTPAVGDGIATLKDLSELEGKVPVDLVYTGANVSAADYPFDDDGNLTVDIRSQDGIRIPACMHARAYVQNNSNKKSLSFTFVNDCAIIEIYSLTGIKDNASLSSYASLTNIGVSNLLLQGKYSLGADGFTFSKEDGTNESDFSVDLSNTNWCVKPDGSIYNSESSENRFLIAVVPNDTPNQIDVNAYINGITDPYGYNYGNHSFEAGKCYVIHEADVVAKTADGQYFKTVKEAFAHAKDLFAQPAYNTAEKNIVTLIRDCGIGGINAQGESITGDTASIDIDGYDATFNLNGHILTFAGNMECFNVKKDKTLIITDSNYDLPGKIYSDTVDWISTYDCDHGCHLVCNYGDVIIQDATLWHNQDMCAVKNYEGSTLTVNGCSVLYSGGYYAISSSGEITINNGTISADYDTINNSSGGTVVVNGGIIYSEDYNAIFNEDASLTINDGTLYSVNSVAIYFKHTDDNVLSLTIVESDKDNNSYPLIYNRANCAAIQVNDNSNNGTNFYMRNGLVYSNYGAVDIQGNVSGEISGGQLEGDTYCALAIGNGANITVSGGHFFIKKNDVNAAAAIRAYNKYADTNTSLTIKGGDDEPLIYADGTTNVSIDARLFTYNSAKIYLNGGYYYSNTDCFYKESRDEPNNYNLQTTDFGNFYSNKSKMELDSYTYVGYDLSAESGNYMFNGKVAKTLNTAISINATFHKIVEGGDGTYDLVQDSTKLLEFSYHITDPGDSKTSGTQSYQFGGFSW